MRSTILALALGGFAVALAGLAIPAAGAATLTGSAATFQANAPGLTATPSMGLFDPFALNLPTTSVLTLNDGQSLRLSNAAQVDQAASTPFGSYPYALSDGFGGDLLIPVDGSGNQLMTQTLTPTSGSLSAFGFEVAPYSNNQKGPFSLTVTLSTGQVLTASAPGGDLNTGLTTADFFGYYGGPVSSLTIATNDPNGFAFGNFVDVPEPASVVLLAAGMLGLAGMRRRT